MLRHRPVDVAPERHHEIGDAVEPLPSPLVEFRRLAVARRQRIDFVVASCETQREPFLPLAAEISPAGVMTARYTAETRKSAIRFRRDRSRSARRSLPTIRASSHRADYHRRL